MKYLLISGSIAPTYCGIGKFSAKVARLLKKRGIAVSYLTNQDQLEFNSQDLPLDPDIIVSQADLLRGGFWQIVSIVRKLQPDIVNIQYQTFSKNLIDALFPLAIHLGRPKAKVVATVHEFAGFSRKGKLRSSLAMLFANRILFSDQLQFQSAKEFPLSRLFLKKAQALVTGPSITNYLSRFTPPAFTDPVLHIGFHGLIQPAKGLHFLLEALAVADFPFHLHILGEFRPLLNYGSAEEVVKYQQELQAQISQSPKLKENTTVHGDIDPTTQQFQTILAKVELLVFPFIDGLTIRRSSFANSLLNSNSLIASTYQEGISEPFLEPVLAIKPTAGSIREFLEQYRKFSVEEKREYAERLLVLKNFLLSPDLERTTVRQLLLQSPKT